MREANSIDPWVQVEEGEGNLPLIDQIHVGALLLAHCVSSEHARAQPYAQRNRQHNDARRSSKYEARSASLAFASERAGAHHPAETCVIHSYNASVLRVKYQYSLGAPA
ncbi:hypothetical protein [Leifsonia sp. 71-9]|uniref:hypothetical protein n=1 Tax=Leifsonia sp. 71-9 TaxID=1895934 RepID=UPI0025BFE8C1|nr:hypothetical protein [Leifsonia sp. 71-9]